MKILIYSKPNCSHCEELKVELDNIDVVYESRDILQVEEDERNSVRAEAKSNGQRMMPIVYVDGVFTRPEEVIRKINK